MPETKQLLDIKEASVWATEFLGKSVTPSNISYLINYGRVSKAGSNGGTLVAKQDLIDYYETAQREIVWKKQLGADLNWALSFDQYTESQTTKHVHRLHPYKGKFIPQLVEYFLDDHTDKFKTETFFAKGDIVLDPFCGSGTTLVQANELGINAIGIDISAFNALISNIKVKKVNIGELQKHINDISRWLRAFTSEQTNIEFETKLTEYLNKYNNKYFPSPEFKIRARSKDFDDKAYAAEHEAIVLKKYQEHVKLYDIKLEQVNSGRFLDKWFVVPIREEIESVFAAIKQVESQEIRDVLTVILSRTIRSCRATTHADLATLVEPVTTTYYCAKHGKICKPLFTIVGWWERYAADTVKRLAQFDDKLRTDTVQICLNADSTNIDLLAELEKQNKPFAKLAKKQKIRGIFSSPPYVGLIDYHEQHAYAYDLFGFERRDAQEIGAMHKKQSKQARDDYAEGISKVLKNCRRFLAEDFDIFLVANDKYNLYPQIAENADLLIINQYKRPVLNRTEKDKGAYSEIIFHLKRR
jgi:DNA methylase